MKNIYAILLCIVIIFLTVSTKISRAEKSVVRSQQCSKAKCEKCTNQQDAGCGQTGYRTKVRCIDNAKNITNGVDNVAEDVDKIMDEVKFTVKYQSCGGRVLNNQTWWFFVFQLVCLIVFFIAANHVYKKKQYHYKKLAQSRGGIQVV